MTTDDLAPGLPAATRRLRGMTALLLAVALGLTSTASFARTSTTATKPATEKSASKPSAGKKKPAATRPGKQGTGSAKANAKPAPAKGKAGARDSSTIADRPAEAATASTAIAAPVRETLAIAPARPVAPLPIEATTTNLTAPGVPVAASPVIAASAHELPATVPAKPQPKKEGLRGLASDAAASTLTLLLPQLAAGDDALPLLGRSTQVASDLGRLIAGQSQAATPPNDKVQSLLKRALTLLGTPYRWGGTSPESGFDCSGLVGYVFRTALGIELPRVSRDMARISDALLIKDRSELREGDLVFFSRNRHRIDHVGIYLGEGKFVHAPRTGRDVTVSSLDSGYWAQRFMQARRMPGV